MPRKAARIALVLGVLAFVGAAIHFGYTAYESGNCYTASTDAETGEPQHQVPVKSYDCRLILSRSENRQRADAAIAMLAVLVVIGAAIRLSNASRRTRRFILIAEVAVAAVGIVYTILLATLLR